MHSLASTNTVHDSYLLSELSEYEMSYLTELTELQVVYLL